MPARPQVSIRLATDGKAQVQRDLADIGVAGDAAAQRIARSFERDSATAEAALAKLARTQERLQAISQSPLQQTIGRSTSTGFGDPSGTARASAVAMEQQFARGEQAARQMLASIDPLFAAQMRYNAAIEQTNLLEAQGVQIEGGFARVRAGLKAQLDDTTALYGKHGAAIGNARIAQMEMMHVVRGSVDQYAAGAAPLQIFTMHLGMLSQAASLSGESLGKVGAFLSTGWGMAATVAVVVLAPLVAKLFEAGDGADALVEKLKKEAQQNALNDEAHRVFANTIDGVTEALHKNRDAMKQLEDADKSAAQKALANAEAQLKKAVAIRAATVAALGQAEAELRQAQATTFGAAGGAGAGAAIGFYSQQVLDVQKSRDQAEADLKIAQAQLAEAQSLVAVERGQQDAAARIKAHYATLIEQTRARLVNEKATTAEIERQTRALHDRELADIKAAEERDRKPGKNAGGTEIFNDQIARYFDIANKYRGKSETADKGVLEQFFREANLQLDPEKTAWCAAFVNAVLAAGGVTGTGSLAAQSFLGFGKDDTHSPQKGDIVIVRSGGSPSGMHVGFLDSIDSKGNVNVLGGNTGNRVGESTFKASDVLGVRRPSTPAEAFSDQAKTAQEEQDALYKLLNTEAEVSVVKEHQVNLAQQLFHANGDLEDNIRHGILPALKDWDRQFERMMASAQEFKNFAGHELDQLFNIDNWKNWGDFGLRVLHDLAQEMLTLAALNPLKNWLLGENNPTAGGGFLSTIFSGIGAIAGGLFGGGGGADWNFGASGGYDATNAGLVGGLATGTEYFGGGMTWVGEHGRELLRLPRGSKITPAAESRRLAAANDGGIGSINIPINIDATGADAAEVARLRADLQQLKQDLPGHVVSAYYEAKQRFVIA